jgi:ATP-dependent DNA helicase RecG
MAFVDLPVSSIKGVGKSRAAQLKRLGIETVQDLIYFFPRAYERRGDVKTVATVTEGEPVSLILTVGSTVQSARLKNRMTISKFKAFDDSGAIEIIFFNSPFVKDVFTVGATFRFFGKISYSKNIVRMSGPKYEPYLASEPLPDLVPVYHLTEGLSSKILERLIAAVIDDAVRSISDHIPPQLLYRHSLPALSMAIKNAHFPTDENMLSRAISRLAFDEMLLFGLGVALCSSVKDRGAGIKFAPCSLTPVLELLPYELTDDQKMAVNDIYRDTVLGKGGEITPMARIIVGDVGSGKTVCALLALYIAVSSGYQAALMVPTEILARQHFEEISGYFAKLGITVDLLLGSTTQKEKNRIYADVSSGKTKVVIGTHALISDKLSFMDLGLVVTDEQHRFGVSQRSSLATKGKKAHMLVMSATPIPRTLALAMYGDLDVSRITHLPSGRQRVDTFAVDGGYRERINDFIKKQIALGGQCYVVCPAIEDTDGEADTVVPSSITSPFSSSQEKLINATEHTEYLRKALPGIRVECLHGKMKPAEKDEIMHRFSLGEIDVLVSTTVIEIGINVPNASLMIIECADRFGLSSLHQLRGRVGRGSRKSYCILVSNSRSEKAMERLGIMRTTYDGYEIAERDLMMRGPGDFFSLNTADSFRQSGGFDFKFAKLCDDNELFGAAFSAAKSIAESDPELTLPEHAGLKARLKNIFDISYGSIS